MFFFLVLRAISAITLAMHVLCLEPEIGSHGEVTSPLRYSIKQIDLFVAILENGRNLVFSIGKCDRIDLITI